MKMNHIWDSPLSFSQFRKCLAGLLGKEYRLIERDDYVEFPPSEVAKPLLCSLDATSCFRHVLRSYQKQSQVNHSFAMLVDNALEGVLYYEDLLALLNITGTCLDQRRSPEKKLQFLLARTAVVRDELEVLTLKQQILEVKKQRVQCLPDAKPVAAFMLKYELQAQGKKIASRTVVQGFILDMLGWLREG
jgi:hypothetical protein